MGERDKTWNMNVNLRDFPRDTLLAIKNAADKHNSKREWFANVYYHDDKYVLGAPVMGDYSGVKIQPDEQTVKDKFYTGVKDCMGDGTGKETCIGLMNEQLKSRGNQMFASDKTSLGASPDELVLPLHQHPINATELPGTRQIRSQFSGTDIASEFAKSIRDGKNYRLALVYPRKEKGRNHTMLKMITFPGKSSYEVMRASNPHLTPQQISSIGTDGKNLKIADWYKYQDEAKKRGHLQEIDIEQSTGTEAYRSYANYYGAFVVGGIALTVLTVFLINRYKKKKGENK